MIALICFVCLVAIAWVAERLEMHGVWRDILFFFRKGK